MMQIRNRIRGHRRVRAGDLLPHELNYRLHPEAQRAAFEASRISITVVQRNDKQVKGFVVLPKRWVVERTLGWINRARRLARLSTQPV